MRPSTKENLLLFYQIIHVAFLWFMAALATAYLVTEVTGASDTLRQVLTAVISIPAIGVYLYKLFRSRGFFENCDKKIKEWVKKCRPPPEKLCKD